MRILKSISAIFFVIFIGCATGSYIVTGTIRPAIDPSQVKIYINPLPSEYETIGIVEASGEVEFSTKAAQDRAINELKSQAVKIGANGIILGNIGSNVSGSVGIY